MVGASPLYLEHIVGVSLLVGGLTSIIFIVSEHKSHARAAPTGQQALPTNFHIHLHYCPLCMTCYCSESESVCRCSPVVWLDVVELRRFNCVGWGDEVE